MPAEWISGDLAIAGLHFGKFVVDWSWKGSTMTVTVRGGKPGHVRIGTMFPADAQLVVHYIDDQGTVANAR